MPDCPTCHKPLDTTGWAPEGWCSRCELRYPLDWDYVDEDSYAGWVEGPGVPCTSEEWVERSP